MANLESNKTAVLDRRTNDNTSIEFGDFVSCCNCGRIMLVNIGTHRCPECEEETLTWEDDEHTEVSDDFFEQNDTYLLTDTE